MGYTREFITPQIEWVQADAALTVEEAQEWAEARLVYIAEHRDEPYGLIIDVRVLARIPLQIMMVMVDLVRRARQTEGYVALVGATRITASMAEAVMRIVPQRQERFCVLEDFDQALSWVQTMLG